MTLITFNESKWLIVSISLTLILSQLPEQVRRRPALHRRRGHLLAEGQRLPRLHPSVRAERSSLLTGQPGTHIQFHILKSNLSVNIIYEIKSTICITGLHFIYGFQKQEVFWSSSKSGPTWVSGGVIHQVSFAIWVRSFGLVSSETFKICRRFGRQWEDLMQLWKENKKNYRKRLYIYFYSFGF